MNDDQIQALEGISSTLLGMNFDPRIPGDTRAVLVKKSKEIDAVLLDPNTSTPDQEATVLKDSEFKRCAFGPDTTTCDHCDLPGLQLYYRRTCHDVDEGEYVCLCCIAVKKARDDAEGRYIDLEVEKQRLEGLLREVEVPGVLIAGEVRINYDLKGRIAAALPKETPDGSAR